MQALCISIAYTWRGKQSSNITNLLFRVHVAVDRSLVV